LVLKSSPKQEQALKMLLDQQQDKRSPNYHRWLTPDEFGVAFGVEQTDIEQVTGWLTKHGFRVDDVARGRRSVAFSGKAGQVEDAFHTEIHSYAVNSERHISNSTDLSVPAAIASVVAGVVSLDDFRPKFSPAVRSTPERVASFQKPHAYLTDGSVHYIVPGDFAVIYNTLPLLLNVAGVGEQIDGNNQTIAILDSSSAITPHDPNIIEFRQLFLPAYNADNTNVISNATTSCPSGTGGDSEAYADVEWAGAVAPGATIAYLPSSNWFCTANYAIQNNIASIMSLSFGTCELQFTAQQTTYVQELWEQAAAQGITVFVSAGDSGSANCDNPQLETISSGGYAVNGIASAPYDIAVGGTEFADQSEQDLYWGSSNPNAVNNGFPYTSALGYIPEEVWNESAANGGSGIWAGGGGVSYCYARPSWQTGPGVPMTDPISPCDPTTQNCPSCPTVPGPHRYMPDVSLTSALHDGYFICEDGDCDNESPTQISISNNIVDGTSLATPAFAGIQALIDQQYGRQGQANYVYYNLAAQQNTAACNSFRAEGPDPSCIFNDVTYGSNGVPCVEGSATTCTVAGISGGQPLYVLQDFSAGTGYDLATGLGSVNVLNLFNAWDNADFTATVRETYTSIQLTSPSSGVASYGQAVQFTATVYVPSDAAAGPSLTGQTVTFSGITCSETQSNAGVLSLNIVAGYPNYVANCTSAYLPVGADSVAASFSPGSLSSYYSPSQSTAATVIVQQLSSTLTLASVSVNPSAVAAGGSATLTINLSGPAPAGGATVAIQVSPQSVLQPITSVTVPAGSTTGTTAITALAVPVSSNVVITAVYSSTSESTTLSVSGSFARWTHTWGGPSNDYANAVAVDNSGNVYVAGSTASFGAGGTSALILKYSPLGTLLWAETWGSSGDDAAVAIAVGPDGFLYATGSSGSVSTSIFVLKLDTNGNLQWGTNWAAGRYNSGNALAFDSAGNIYVVGNPFSALVIKLSASDGSVLWASSFTVPNSAAGGDPTETSGSAVTVDLNGNVIIAGTWAWYNIDNNLWSPLLLLVKYDANGNYLWNIALADGTYPGGSRSVVTDAQGNIYVAGGAAYVSCYYQTCTQTGSDATALKFDSGGALQWEDTWGGTGFNSATSAAIDPSGHLLVSGVQNQNGQSPTPFILSYDGNGNLLSSTGWQAQEPLSPGYAASMVLDNAGGVYLASAELNNLGTWVSVSATAGTLPYSTETLPYTLATPSAQVSSPSIPTVSQTGGVVDAGGGGADAFISVLAVPSGGPVAGLSTLVLTFGNQTISTASSPQSVTLTNSGYATLTVVNITTSGNFSQTNTCGGSVSAGSSCTITVTFNPATTGLGIGTLEITDNSGGVSGTIQSVALSGTGIGPVASMSATTLSFGSQQVGVVSPPQTVILQNTGNGSLSIASIVLSGPNAGDFSDNISCGTSLGAGASCTISVTFTPSLVGPESAAVVITDDAAGSPQTVSLTGAGAQAATTTSISAPAISYGTAANVTVTVTSGQGTVSGNVSLIVDNSSPFTQPLSGGWTVFTVSGLGGGSHSLIASYAAQGGFAASSATGSLQVNQIQPSVTFTGAPATAPYHSTFAVAATTNASTTAVITASGACSISGYIVAMTAPTGTCLLTAAWASDNNFLAASATQSTTATKATPTVTFTGAPLTAAYGSTFTITSTTNASTKPTYTGTAGICSVSGSTVTMKSGTGTCTLAANWAADINYVAATATQTTTAVTANTTVAIGAHTPNPSVVGQAVAVNITVAPTAPATTNPTGNVTVSDGMGDTCKATLSSGSGSCNVSISAAGAQTLAATYNGSTNFSTSSSAGVSQTVNAASTTTAIAASPGTSVTGQPVTVKFKLAVVSPGKGTPTGTVTVNDGAGDACGAPVATGSCVLTIATAGSKTLMGSYSGDANFAASASAAITQTVNKASTRTTITGQSPSSSVAGQSVGFTFTVVPVSPGGGTPTGNVTVSDPAGDTCTASITTGTCTITYSASGNKSMTASYAGDANFSSSKSATVTEPVTDFSISAPATKTVKAGSQGTITITVAPKNGFTGAVALSCSAPAGVSCSLSPASVTPSGSSVTSTATVGSATKGSYTLTFTGVYGSGAPVSGGLTHSTNVSLTVN
jgi:hypothetical protein